MDQSVMSEPTDRKRNRINRTHGGDQASSTHALPGGGSAEPPARPAGGGGYPGGCTTTSAPYGDDRLADLRALGLDARWIEVAQEIGFEAFIATWRILDRRSQQLAEPRICVPAFDSTWSRYQRNRLIRQLAQADYPVPDIQSRLQAERRETLSRRHIERIIAQDTMGS